MIEDEKAPEIEFGEELAKLFDPYSEFAELDPFTKCPKAVILTMTLLLYIIKIIIDDIFRRGIGFKTKCFLC